MKLKEILLRIYEDYNVKKTYERFVPTSYCFFRHLSFYPTAMFIKFNITSPNIITFISFVIGIVACFMFSIGYYWTTLLGAILYNLYAIFDHIDGNIARYYKKIVIMES